MVTLEKVPTEITLEKVLAEALELSLDDQRRLIEILSVNQPIKPRKTLEQLAAEQGKKPVNFDELLKLGEFFPEDESVDDLVNFIRESRRDSGVRRIE
jgi:hypothetical protein